MSYFEKYRKYKNLYLKLKAGAQDNWKQTVTRAKGVEKARKKFKEALKWNIRVQTLDGRDATIRIFPGDNVEHLKDLIEVELGVSHYKQELVVDESGEEEPLENHDIIREVLEDNGIVTVVINDMLLNLVNTDGSTTELNFDLFYSWVQKLISGEDNTTTIRKIFEEVHQGEDMRTYLENVGEFVLLTDYLDDDDELMPSSLFTFLNEWMGNNWMNKTPMSVAEDFNSHMTGLEMPLHKEVLIFVIMRMIFGVYNPVIPDSMYEEVRNGLIDNEIIRSHWDNKIWALYWTCRLYSVVHDDDEIYNDWARMDRRVQEIIGESDDLSFVEIYEKLLPCNWLSSFYWTTMDEQAFSQDGSNWGYYGVN